MEDRLTKTSGQQKQPVNISNDTPATKTAVRQLLVLLCLTHRAEITDPLVEAYWVGLSDLTMGQLNRLAELSLKETEFWPSPGRLRKLLGIPTTEELAKLAAEQVEKDALDGLADFLKILRKLRHDPEAIRDKRIAELKVPPLSEKPWVKTLVRFGGGNLDSAVELLLQHPSLRQSGDEVSGFGLDFNSIQKCEQRWISCWKAVA